MHYYTKGDASFLWASLVNIDMRVSSCSDYGQAVASFSTAGGLR